MTPQAYCRQQAAQSGSSFYYSFLFLPPAQRDAIMALYAFCRAVDDVVDNVQDPSVAASKLAWWRSEIDRMYAANAATPATHPICLALYTPALTYGIKANDLKTVIAGMEMDLQQHSYVDDEALSVYCWRVAGIVGQMSARIFSDNLANCDAYALHMGQALQRINIIRDVGEDAMRGRVYLPIDLLNKHGIKMADVLARKPLIVDSHLIPAMLKVLKECAEQAKEHLRLALDALPESQIRNQRSGLIPRFTAARQLNAFEKVVFGLAQLGCPAGCCESASQTGSVKHIAVVGAGWAGLTAALTLQRQGYTVTIYERSPAKAAHYRGAGGRASTAYAAGDRAPFAIDNGQHVLLGAYRDTLALFASLNIQAEQAFLRIPAAWYVPEHLNISIAAWADKNVAKRLCNDGPFKQIPMALALFKASPVGQWPCLLAAAIRLQLLSPRATETVEQWLARLKFPDFFNKYLWLPLCYATLNTAPHTASASVFQRVIQDGLLAGSQAAAMLVPRTDLGDLLPKQALNELSRNGATLKLGSAVARIESTSLGVKVYADGTALTYDALICATCAKDAARLLPFACISTNLKNMAAQTPEPITTIHLNIGDKIRLPKAVCVLPEPNDSNHPIQHAVAIDRAFLQDKQIGWLTVVLSCSSAALSQSREALIQAALIRLKTCFPALAWPSSCQGVVIHAKQATFACTADVLRPAMSTEDPRILLAGDYVVGAYPATLEGAVRSGLNAAASMAYL
jgi:15-cis-phytoene synthase